jgi:hypothetical protein
MAITTIDEKNLAGILTRGMLDGVRSNLKNQLMATLEKEVDLAIDKTLDQFKGHVETTYDYVNDKPVFHISINGIKRCES